jgi:hypothetical protein
MFLSASEGGYTVSKMNDVEVPIPKMHDVAVSIPVEVPIKRKY